MSDQKTEQKHTPGPWYIFADGIEVGTRGDFMPFSGCGCCGSPWMEADDQSQRMADARLIVSAPDLLEALKDCRRALELANAVGELAVVDAAIAKATGGRHG